MRIILYLLTIITISTSCFADTVIVFNIVDINNNPIPDCSVSFVFNEDLNKDLLNSNPILYNELVSKYLSNSTYSEKRTDRTGSLVFIVPSGYWFTLQFRDKISHAEFLDFKDGINIVNVIYDSSNPLTVVRFNNVKSLESIITDLRTITGGNNVKK